MTDAELLNLCKERLEGYPDGAQAEKIDIQIKKLEDRCKKDQAKK
jgi:hypothetical protein